MIVGHVYTVSLYSTWSMKINSFSYWDLKYYFLRSPKSAAYVIFAISFMGTFILVSVHIILIVALPCLFGEAKPCQAGLVLGQGTPFGILIYFDFKFIFQKKEFHCLNTLIEVTFIRFRVRRNCKGLSLIIFVCLLQVARGSGELELTYSPAFYIIWLVYSLQCSWPTYRVQYIHSWFKEG